MALITARYANSDQANADGDSFGDVCDADDDGDGIADVVDNCPLSPTAIRPMRMAIVSAMCVIPTMTVMALRTLLITAR